MTISDKLEAPCKQAILAFQMDELFVLLRGPMSGCMRMRYSFSHQEAEDWFQEFMLVLIRRHDRYDPNLGPVMPWLWSVASHTARDYVRARRHKKFKPLEKCDDPFVNDDPIRTLEQAELLTALQTLSPADRDLIVLRYMEELTLKAIATRLGRRVSTVDSQIKRALTKIKQALSLPGG